VEQLVALHYFSKGIKRDTHRTYILILNVYKTDLANTIAQPNICHIPQLNDHQCAHCQGYTFEAKRNRHTIMVRVPVGGVEIEQKFSIPFRIVQVFRLRNIKVVGPCWSLEGEF
jgi:hypothetical protein